MTSRLIRDSRAVDSFMQVLRVVAGHWGATSRHSETKQRLRCKLQDGPHATALFYFFVSSSGCGFSFYVPFRGFQLQRTANSPKKEFSYSHNSLLNTSTSIVTTFRFYYR